jgi:NAD-dependent deacetylase sirtuin 1
MEFNNSDIEVPDDMSRMHIFQMLLRCLGGRFEARKRQRKCNIDDAIDLIRNSKKIIVLTGAGISVSCGIPDFRSRNGLYAKLAVDFPELPDPQSMFCLRFFKEDPRPFFRFAKEIFPGKYKPSPSHNFIAKLEKEKKMTRLYSQNIDGLEQQAGIDNVIQCHGHFYTAHCLRCGAEYKIEELKERILSSEVPLCEKIISNETEEISSVETCKGVIKPDIVFFGESLPKHFHAAMTQDKDDVDLLIVMGSSLKVGPVNDIPDAIPDNVPRILSKFSI